MLRREGIPISILLVKELECRPESRSMLQLPRLHPWESLEEVEVLGAGVIGDCTVILAPALWLMKLSKPDRTICQHKPCNLKDSLPRGPRNI